jgi:hypothetical protein
MTRFRIKALILLVLFSGCSKKAIRYGANLPPKPPNSYIAVFTNGGVDQRYAPIGEMAMRNTTPRTINSVLKWAREVGADAVIIDEIGKRPKAVAIVFAPTVRKAQNDSVRVQLENASTKGKDST